MSLLEEVLFSQANAFSFLVPVFGLGMGAAFFNETLDWFTGLCVALAISAIILASKGSADANTELPVRN